MYNKNSLHSSLSTLQTYKTLNNKNHKYNTKTNNKIKNDKNKKNFYKEKVINNLSESIIGLKMDINRLKEERDKKEIEILDKEKEINHLEELIEEFRGNKTEMSISELQTDLNNEDLKEKKNENGLRESINSVITFKNEDNISNNNNFDNNNQIKQLYINNDNNYYYQNDYNISKKYKPKIQTKYIKNRSISCQKIPIFSNPNLYRNQQYFYQPIQYLVPSFFISYQPPPTHYLINEQRNKQLYKYLNIISTWINPNKIHDFYLLYSNLFFPDSVKIFHEKCDFKGPTVTIIKSNTDYIFGGYTTKNWDISNRWKYDPDSFIFSLTFKKKFIKNKNDKLSIYCGEFQGPTFGAGCDIFIADCFTQTYMNKVEMDSYEPILHKKIYSPFILNGGEKYFYVKEINVFQVI